MTNRAEIQRLTTKAGIALAIAAVAIVFCYFFVDRAVAIYMHEHAIAKTPGVIHFTYFPPIVQEWSPVLVALAILDWAFIAERRWQRVIIAACLSLLFADQIRESIAYVAGRYWPETWGHDGVNQGLIGSGKYGFHAFETGDETGSFPSGHASRIAGFLGVLWVAWPRGRVVYSLLGVALSISLILMNYHFVGDVIAGLTIGGIVAAYGSLLFGLNAPRNESPTQAGGPTDE